MPLRLFQEFQPALVGFGGEWSRSSHLVFTNRYFSRTFYPCKAFQISHCMELSHLHSFPRAVVPEILGVGMLEDNGAGFYVFLISILISLMDHKLLRRTIKLSYSQ